MSMLGRGLKLSRRLARAERFAAARAAWDSGWVLSVEYDEVCAGPETVRWGCVDEWWPKPRLVPYPPRDADLEDEFVVATPALRLNVCKPFPPVDASALVREGNDDDVDGVFPPPL